MRRADGRIAVEIGNGPCDSKRSVVAAGGEGAPLSRLYEQAMSIIGEPPARIEPPTGRSAVTSDIVERDVTRPLNEPSGIHPAPNLGGSLGAACQCQRPDGDRADLDSNIDAIHERA